MIVIPLESVVLKHVVRAPGSSAQTPYFSRKHGHACSYLPELGMVRIRQGTDDRWIPASDVREFGVHPEWLAQHEEDFGLGWDGQEYANAPASIADARDRRDMVQAIEAVRAADTGPDAAIMPRVMAEEMGAHVTELRAAPAKPARPRGKSRSRSRKAVPSKPPTPPSELDTLRAELARTQAMLQAQSQSPAVSTVPPIPPQVLLAKADGGRNFSSRHFPPMSRGKNGGAQ